MIERHHQVLRNTVRKLVAQAQLEGIPINMDELVDEAVEAKNTIITVKGGVTPQEAVFGVKSPLLPDMSEGDAPLEDPDGRTVHRTREMALQAMIQVTAEERIKGALRSKTRKSTKAENYVHGDAVEFWRQPVNKDSSGWKGPAVVVAVDDEQGIIWVRWQGQCLLCRPADVRKTFSVG